jgi:hypothetical protein
MVAHGGTAVNPVNRRRGKVGKLTRSKPTSSGVRVWGSKGGVLTGVRLPTASAVGWASSTATTWPEGRLWLLMSRRGVVHQWGPHGGGGWTAGRLEVADDNLGGAQCSGAVRCRGAARRSSRTR